mmetsp:Transcript_828/g.2611  ORF Transcript_828/g.2611 Transcript_828/m.2611 type:complete len:255 (-) Transcript_828:463-1227(-)
MRLSRRLAIGRLAGFEPRLHRLADEVAGRRPRTPDVANTCGRAAAFGGIAGRCAAPHSRDGACRRRWRCAAEEVVPAALYRQQHWRQDEPRLEIIAGPSRRCWRRWSLLGYVFGEIELGLVSRGATVGCFKARSRRRHWSHKQGRRRRRHARQRLAHQRRLPSRGDLAGDEATARRAQEGSAERAGHRGEDEGRHAARGGEAKEGRARRRPQGHSRDKEAGVGGHEPVCGKATADPENRRTAGESRVPGVQALR